MRNLIRELLGLSVVLLFMAGVAAVSMHPWLPVLAGIAFIMLAAVALERKPGQWLYEHSEAIFDKLNLP